MPRKPFDYMIVRLEKDYGANYFKRGEICIVTPHNWYGNTNGWCKNDPEAATFEREEQEKYKLNPHAIHYDRTYWNQERGYALYSKDSEYSCIIDWSNARWSVLNIDGKDQSPGVGDCPPEASKTLERYLKK